MPSRPPRRSSPGAGQDVSWSSSSAPASDRSTQQEDGKIGSATPTTCGTDASRPDDTSNDTSNDTSSDSFGGASPDAPLASTSRPTSAPDPAQQWWTTAEIAEHCGISRASVRAYVSRGILPAPATTIGRTPVWHPQAVIEAHAARRGRGWRRDA